MKKRILLALYFVLLAAYSVWSWMLVNPNLYFSTNAVYVEAQNWLTAQYASNHQGMTTIYVCLTVLLFGVYIAILRDTRGEKSSLWPLLLVATPLVLAYNALSSDVFNYLFNAKMVAVYHDNPHVHTALDYPSDDWTRFMHNTHTPAPYGYGWTLASLLPYSLGMGKYTLAWLSLRIFNVILLVATVIALAHLTRKSHLDTPTNALLLFWLNPLVLIEIIGNIHNDLWMMLPAVWALSLVYPDGTKVSGKKVWLAVGCFLFSLSVKYATLVLLPFWLYLLMSAGTISVGKQVLQKLSEIKPFDMLFSLVNRYFFDFCALALFLPLLTSRSQRFHPWYLTWALVLAPLATANVTRISLLILSVSAMMRYVPFLWQGDYNDAVLLEQQIIALLPVFLYWVWMAGRYWWRKYGRNSAKKGV